MLLLPSLSPPSLPLHPATTSSTRSGALRASHSVFVACVRLIRGDIMGGQGEPEELVRGEELTEWGRQGGTRARPAAKSKNRGSESLGNRRGGTTVFSRQFALVSCRNPLVALAQGRRFLCRRKSSPLWPRLSSSSLPYLNTDSIRQRPPVGVGVFLLALEPNTSA